MNKDRRSEVAGAIVQLSAIREQIDALIEEVERIQSEEQDYFDNMPESFQGGEKGQLAEEAIGNFESAIDELRNFDFGGVEEYLEYAAS